MFVGETGKPEMASGKSWGYDDRRFACFLFIFMQRFLAHSDMFLQIAPAPSQSAVFHGRLLNGWATPSFFAFIS
jgi:hypothetical protein